MTAKKAPDVLGDRARAQMVSNSLQTLQQQQFDLRLRQTMEGAAGSDASGYVDPQSGAAVSYDDRLQQLRDGEQRVLADFGDVLPIIEESIQARGGG